MKQLWEVVKSFDTFDKALLGGVLTLAILMTLVALYFNLHADM